MRADTAVVGAICLWASCGVAAAQDKTLTEGRPLTRLGDAFPIGEGEGAVVAGALATLQRAGPARGLFPVQLQYGVLPNTQLSLGTTFASHPHDADDPHAGDLTGSVRVNFGRETVVMPSFATALSITIPSGVDAKATVYDLKGYATKTFGFSLFGHVNAAVQFADRVERTERQARYRLAIGANYVVPELSALVVAADLFSDQSKAVGQPNTTGLEAGIRYRLTRNLYWDAGAGTEFAGPRDRAVFFVTTGATFGFTVGGP
jgi:hypothetical protein